MNKQKQSLQVFLCHSSNDKEIVEDIYNILIEDGIDAWLDRKNLTPGEEWQIEIPRALRNVDIVIVFLSSNSVTKEGYVQREIKIALDIADEKPEGTIFIIPTRLEDCNIPSRLSKFQAVDLFNKNGYKNLLKSLQIRANGINKPLKLEQESRTTEKTSNLIAKLLSEKENKLTKIALSGSFSRGKTTLINALLGKEILTTKFFPNTAMPTILKYGLPERFRVNHKIIPPWAINEIKSYNLKEDLSKFSFDTIDFLKHPDGGNFKDFENLEVWCESSFLKENRVILIDTPAEDSLATFAKELNKQVFPFADIVIHVSQADPPVSELDITFLRYLIENKKQVIVVINKIDMVTKNELRGLINFVKETLYKHLQLDTLIIPISAKYAINGEYNKSGFHKLIPTLEQLIASHNKSA